MPPNQQTPPQNDNSIFMTKVTPPPKTNQDKERRTMTRITVGLIIGFAVIVVALFMLLFIGANSAAGDYKAATIAHMAKVTKSIKSVDVDAVLNQRDISSTIADVQKLEKTHPRLPSVLFADSISASYQDSVNGEAKIDAFYTRATAFTQELPGLLTFAQATDETQDDLQAIISGVTVTRNSQAKTIAGSIDDLAARVKDLSVPLALVESRDTLAKSYTELAEGYRDVGDTFTDTASSRAQANRRVASALRDIEKNSDSSTYAQKVKQSVAQLVAEGEALASNL